MKHRCNRRHRTHRLQAAGWRLAVVLLVLGTLVFASRASASARVADDGSGGPAIYRQTNLVSDVPGLAAVTDSRLVNAWGISFGPSTPFWISDNGTGLSTLYDGAGTPFPPMAPLTVTIPPPSGSASGTAATPTGQVFNGTPNEFVVTKGTASAASLFIFATEDGTISGWNRSVDPTHAILAVDNAASGAVYKGLALGHSSAGDMLYGANFHAGTIDVFDAHFASAHLTGSFADPAIPAGFAPFNIRNIGGELYVTYAKQNAARHDDVAGRGNGFVDVFSTDGVLLRRLASGGKLNSPWGLALAPATQGRVSNQLLVGNFGDGRINVFDPQSGAFRGQLRDTTHHALTIPGLWALTFGNNGPNIDPNTLYFTAGPGDEQHGLFGSLSLVQRGDEHGHGDGDGGGDGHGDGRGTRHGQGGDAATRV